MDESAADEVLLSKVFTQLAAWKAAKKNATLKFSADAVTAADVVGSSVTYVAVIAGNSHS